MWTRKVVLFAGALVVLTSFVHAASDTIIGAVVSTNEKAVQITTKTGTTQSVRLDDKTGYVKWITHQPWQQDSRADRTFLHVGRCVTIDVRPDDPGVAKLIRISTDEVGTVWYPCRH